MEPGKKTIWGFAGNVVQGTISEPLPEDFQSASHVIKTGAIDMISHRKNQKDVITNLVLSSSKNVSHKNILKIAMRKFKQ